jgi:hypothetical protein
MESLFVYSLFQDGFSVTRLFTTNEKVKGKWWIGKDFEESGHDLILRYISGIFPKGLRKITSTLFRIAGIRAEIWNRNLLNPKVDDDGQGWDYVSDLRPPTGLLFIPQVIFEQGEPWCNDVNRGNFWFVRQCTPAIPESSGSRQEEWATGCDAFLFMLARDSLHAVTFYDMGSTALLPLRRNPYCGFYRP